MYSSGKIGSLLNAVEHYWTLLNAVERDWKWSKKVQELSFCAPVNFLLYFRFWSKNGRRVNSLVGSFPQDWEGWRTSFLVCYNSWRQYQDEAWNCNHSCASHRVIFNILANWASPSSPRSASKGSPQPACSCSPGCPGRGSNQCSTARPSTLSTSPTTSLAACWFWEAQGDFSGEAVLSSIIIFHLRWDLPDQSEGAGCGQKHPTENPADQLWIKIIK